MTETTDPITPPDLSKCLIVASVSGGKDSAALSLWLTSQGLEHKRVFADTGWEHDLTYEYLRGPLKAKLGPIDEVQCKVGGMPELIRSKAMFPSRLKRFCTQKLKIDPIREYIAKLQDQGHEIVNAVGIRAGESQARSQMTEWEWSEDFDCWVWRPLIAWSEQQVIDTIRTANLAPNPLYLKGATRVGCWPCIFARKAEVKLVARLSPERIQLIRDLEQEVSSAALARAQASGKAGEFDTEHKFQRTFFHGKLSREGKPFPIDTIVTWSKTKYGGKEEDPVVQEDEQSDGCVRWGMCEKAPDEKLDPERGQELPPVREGEHQGDGVVTPPSSTPTPD
jgi:3'-phosphoadenosine 5'-phosphosulfate sulfotransferase (PAPS reductase)/FAD synthetase